MNRRATIEIFPRLTCLKSRVVALVSLVSKVLFCYCVVRIKVYSLGYIRACLLCFSCFISRVVCIQFCLLVAVVSLVSRVFFHYYVGWYCVRCGRVCSLVSRVLFPYGCAAVESVFVLCICSLVSKDLFPCGCSRVHIPCFCFYFSWCWQFLEIK